MAADPVSAPQADHPPAQDGKLSPVLAAALFGGAVAATAGAYFGTRALARRNGSTDGRPINSVMATAITACDLAHDKGVAEPKSKVEPKVPVEPAV